MSHETTPKLKKSHDAGYKRLFSHAEFVRDLILGFIPNPWLQSLDFTTLERCSGSYITDDMRERADDLIWRIKSGEDWLYLYLLIEFQSTIDPYMAVRIMTYVGLLYQDLVKTEQISHRGHLPPVLPIVLYNGKQRWSAAIDISEQIGNLPDSLDIFRPHVRYLLIEEHSYTDADLASLHNLTAAIFRLEQMPNLEGVLEITLALKTWLNAPEQQELRRSIAIWVRAALIQHKEYPLFLPEIDNLQELNSMLSERVGEWARQYQREGWEKGHQEGIQTGLNKGRQEGRQEGETRLLLKLLRLRFGEVPSWVQQRLASAETSQLEAWGERVLTATSLETVFE